MSYQPSGSYRSTHISANGNGDAVKSGSGVLHSVTINTTGASGNTLTLYDSLTHGSGTTVAVIDTTAGVVTLLLDAWLQVGLSYSLATGTAADVTMTWI